MSIITYQPIGLIHSPFKDIQGMPVQPAGAVGIRGTVEVYPEYAQGLKDLDGFSHIFLLYHFHKSRDSVLLVTPFLDTQQRGVFSTRAPKRPNPVGISVVRLVAVSDNILHIENTDILNETPLLDIKPYIPEIDNHPADRIGWLEKAKGSVADRKSDDRFGRK